MRRLPLILSLALLPSTATLAAGPDTQALVDELRQLTEKASQQRAADRWLQRALEDMVARYDWPWRNELVFDDFADGDFDRAPHWTVVNGRFWIARGRGLRNRTEYRPTEQPSQQAQPSIESAILGALLESAVNKGNGGQHDSAPANDGGTPSEIRLDTRISNAFAIETEFSLEDPTATGRIAWSLLQGNQGLYGYRLRLATGNGAYLELERVRAGRSAVVDSRTLQRSPADGGTHQLVWRQAPNGDVAVELDGQAVLSVRDKAFRDDYRQLVLTNWSGDLTLHSVRVSGTD